MSRRAECRHWANPEFHFVFWERPRRVWVCLRTDFPVAEERCEDCPFWEPRRAVSDRWFFYVVRAADESLYAGVTTDVDRRVEEHNGGWRGAKCLRGRRPVRVAARSGPMTKSEALRAEARFKRLTRAEKEEALR